VKAESHKADTHALEESDRAILSMNQPNKEERSSAEAGEKRARAKENITQSNMSPTQSGEQVSQGLNGVREAAKNRRQERFTALLHHLNVDLLRKSYYALKRQAAPGVDGVTWKEYETGLEDRLVDLHNRVHRGDYRAQPSRRVYIPKADGRQRPLGIAALEDKIVQQAVVTILNQIYEVDFKGFSYGFRPGGNPHQALDALTVGIQRKRVNWILDADMRGFFDNMSHEWTMKFVEHRIADHRILRLIQKWLKAGVSEDGQWSESKGGTPQGAVVTPRTQKAISSLKEQLRSGEKGIPCLIFVVNRNTFMSNEPFDKDGEGSPAECRSRLVAASNRASRSSSSVVARVRLVRAPSISLPARSLSTRSTDRSSRSHCANYLEASAANRGAAAQIRQEQWSDDWSDRSQRIKCISARSKKAWLNRVKIAAHFKFKSLICLIAYSSRNSRRLTSCWCHVASTPSG